MSVELGEADRDDVDLGARSWPRSPGAPLEGLGDLRPVEREQVDDDALELAGRR